MTYVVQWITDGNGELFLLEIFLAQVSGACNCKSLFVTWRLLRPVVLIYLFEVSIWRASPLKIEISDILSVL